ncbi:thiamine pyrophosphokinase [Planomicrobium stackebrandtii]|uniref:Thiamine diphosphokinase n=1 Tax=Planomicrobium stackebrandtii TaxID=253160 RepID=A0ABU0GR29_9BACL|nr:thiamine diphosphokinase [Planomicrobium stackebrandtii]MDQ0427814.1 thiamine pyrophosphokinase [Planomicrobium stackebrandtii]
MNVILIAGGPAGELPDFSFFPEALYIGIDSGTLVLLEKEIQPAAAVGDFDSVSDEDYEKIRAALPELERYPSEKDQSDTELGLEKAMEYQPEQAILTGVTGGRLDHYMSALHTMFKYQQEFPATRFLLLNNQNRIRFLKPGTHLLVKDEQYRYVSFYPFAEEVGGLTLTGFKYPVTDEAVPFGTTRFISNELLGRGSVTIQSGHCLMVESSDT